jgi:pimeloyl-ACP methyl ester carboxylesterase
MKSTLVDDFTLPAGVNFIRQGDGPPVILVHGIAASLHDWDDLIPDLTRSGYASYALDLLGHGDSPKPESPAYHVDWLYEHFSHWMRSLHLTEPAVLIGHSLGGYIALEYARRVSAWTRGLILVNPLYSRLQLSPFFRRSHTRRNLKGMIAGNTPKWILRAFVNLASILMDTGSGAAHSLPERVRAQTALDYARTAAGVYNVPNEIGETPDFLRQITAPSLVIWGDRDKTLLASSFPKLVEAMPRANGKFFRAGHVPHQSNVKEFNETVLEFLHELMQGKPRERTAVTSTVA